jgi:beta-aspartyl-peptidase (threonine type)
MARTIHVAAGGLSAAIVSQMFSKLARAVMEKSEHVFLIGEGAERFAREHGTSFEDAEYFLTEARIAQLAEAKKKQATVLDHSQTNERKLGGMLTATAENGEVRIQTT